MKTLTIVCAVISVAMAGSWAAGQTPQGNAKDGQAVYQQHCLRCHGDRLDGNGPDSRDLIVQPANLVSPASRTKTDWELLITISNGALFTPMHGFRGRLTNQEMLDVLSYIRAVAPYDTVS